MNQCQYGSETKFQRTQLPKGKNMQVATQTLLLATTQISQKKNIQACQINATAQSQINHLGDAANRQSDFNLTRLLASCGDCV